MKRRAGFVTALGLASVGALLGLATLTDVDHAQIEQDVEEEW